MIKNTLKKSILASVFILVGLSTAFTADKLVSWMEAPSLKDAYAGKIDYIGVAVPHTQWPSNTKILPSASVQAGMKRHFSSFTMENEFKPDSIMGTYYPGAPKNFEDYTDSNGTTIKVPKNQLQFGTVDQCLNIAKANGIKMRGHVLVWHSQTADWFFKEGYKSSGKLVDKTTMTARQEWYIKSVLEHIKAWEDKNNGGKRIVYCWDVVNEAANDSGTKLRDGGSNWYSIYKSDEFIINAFRFANKYAPKDVLLAYNDYNECMSNKRAMILKIIDSVKAHEKDSKLPTRIDVLGMQSHIKQGNPSIAEYEKTIKMYIAKGLDVHITEIEIASMSKADAKNPEKLKESYKETFEMFLRNAKTKNKKGISSVTFWGLHDGVTWLNVPSNGQLRWLNNVHQYPLIFDENLNTKPAFYGVLEAANEAE